MNRIALPAAALLVVGLSITIPIVTPAGAAARAPEEHAAVVRVIDGDTLEVDIGSRHERVRLLGIDAPEKAHGNHPSEPFATQSTAYARRLAGHQHVVLRGDAGHENRDAYDRLLRYVFLPDGRCLNVEMIRAGYARAYTRYHFTRGKEFRADEREARAAGVGMWARQ